MSLTSYRAAPPRAKNMGIDHARQQFFWSAPPTGGLLHPAPDDGLPWQARFSRAGEDCKEEISEQKYITRLIFREPLCRCGYLAWKTRLIFRRPGNDLLSHTLRCSTIGAGAFNGRVRDGIGFRRSAIVTKSAQYETAEIDH
jgi:hypothetical protein